MKTVNKTYYICSICGKTSQQEDKITECQDKHRFVGDDCQVEHSFDKGRPFPKSPLVTFEDGSQASYQQAWVREARPKPVEDVRTCQICGCTDDHACPGGCYWVEDDLCSVCAEKFGAAR